MPFVMRRTRVRRARSTAMPRLIAPAKRDVRLEKAGVDIVPRLITYVVPSSAAIANVSKFTFGGNLDA